MTAPDNRNDAVQFLYKHGDLTYSAAHSAVDKLCSNGFRIVRADLAAVPAKVRVKPLDLSHALKHAFISGRVSAGAASSFHADAWTEYDPTESAGYTRILAAIEPQPDPRDEVIARLVEALEEGRRAIGEHCAPHDCYATGPLTGDAFRDLVQCPACSFIESHDAALAAAKAVQHD